MRARAVRLPGAVLACALIALALAAPAYAWGEEVPPAEGSGEPVAVQDAALPEEPVPAPDPVEGAEPSDEPPVSEEPAPEPDPAEGADPADEPPVSEDPAPANSMEARFGDLYVSPFDVERRYVAFATPELAAEIDAMVGTVYTDHQFVMHYAEGLGDEDIKGIVRLIDGARVMFLAEHACYMTIVLPDDFSLFRAAEIYRQDPRIELAHLHRTGSMENPPGDVRVITERDYGGGDDPVPPEKDEPAPPVAADPGNGGQLGKTGDAAPVAALAAALMGSLAAGAVALRVGRSRGEANESI